MLDATGDRARLQGYVEHMTRASLGLAIAAGSGLALLGEPILSLWLGPGYSPGRPVIWILGALLPVAILVHSANTAVAAVGRHHRQAWIWVLEIVLNLGLSIPLAWEVGVAGVAFGTLVARVLATPFYVGDAVSKLGLDLPRMLSRVLAPNLALLLLFMGWVWLLLGSGPSAPSHLALVSGGHLLISVASLAALVPREVRARMLVRLRRVLSV
jgi:O-antigen/teichoic acid export membrane protein